MLYNSIHKFELDIDPTSLIICANRSRYKMAKSKHLRDLLSNSAFVDSKIIKEDDDDEWYKMIDKTIRKSTTCQATYITFCKHPFDGVTDYGYGDRYIYIHNGHTVTYEYGHIVDPIEMEIRRISPSYLRDSIESAIKRNQYNGCFSGLNCTLRIDKYTVGDFYDRHKCRATSPYHFITVIILIPPLTEELIHQGGLLRIWDGTDEVYEIDANKIKKITVIAFNPTFEYEITPVTSGTLMLFKTEWSYNEAMLNLAISHGKHGITKLEEMKMDHSKQINDMMTIKELFNKEFDKMTDAIASFKSTEFMRFTCVVLDGISNAISAVNDTTIRTIRYNVDGLINHLKTLIGTKKFAIIPLLNFYEEGTTSMYPNELELFNELRRSFGKIGIKNMCKRLKYYTRFPEPNDLYRCENNNNIEIEVSGDVVLYDSYTPMIDQLAYKHVTLVQIDKYISNAEKTGTLEKLWIFEDGRYNRVHDIWHTYFVIKIWDYEMIMAFVGIWYLRKADCPHLGKVPKDIMKMIISLL